jgi:lipoprotein-anchoring transpeptidase ErfK/SrfK
VTLVSFVVNLFMKQLAEISRRDFLKLAAAGLLGSLFSGLRLEPAFADDLHADQQGRVTAATINVYDTPSTTGKFVNSYWRDTVLPITGVAISDDEGAHNRVWYQVGGGAYTYSGAVQPVRTLLNQPVAEIPKSGQLAELTVPYSDAHTAADGASKLLYRMYYGTTYWVIALAQALDGTAWYKFWDEKRKKGYYAPAAHLRLVPAAELAPISPGLDYRLKRVQVRLNDQLVVAYEDQVPVYMARASTGAKYYGRYSTPVGRHITNFKRATRHMAAGDLASDGYDLPGVPWVSYLTEKGVSFHGTYWHNDFGRPRSHGCINLTPEAAKWIYLWTQPPVPADQSFEYKDWGTAVAVIE